MSNQGIMEGKKSPGECTYVFLVLGCTITSEGELARSSVSAADAAYSQYARFPFPDGCHFVAVGSGYKRARGVESSRIVAYLTEGKGVSNLQITEEKFSYNTPMNAVCTAAAIFDGRQQAQKFYLCTDPIHAVRAWITFRVIWLWLGFGWPSLRLIPGRWPGYGDSDKWFLKNWFVWSLWNLIGIIVLPFWTILFARREFAKLRCSK